MFQQLGPWSKMTEALFVLMKWRLDYGFRKWKEI